MMAVLLLRLVGPMQSWGTRSRFVDRDTERFPSKSGVIGLVCAALGRPRSVAVDDLAALSMAARADRPGRVETDFQVTQGALRASGSVSRDPLPSYRHYLADAAFLVGLEGDRGLLEGCWHALAEPVWTLYLGRKGHVPSQPVHLTDGLRAESLDEAVATYPLVISIPPWRGLAPVEVEWETTPDQGGLPRCDVPVCFANGRRQFRLRWVRHEALSQPPPSKEVGDASDATTA